MNAYANGIALITAESNLTTYQQGAEAARQLPWYGFLATEVDVSLSNVQRRLKLADDFRQLSPSVFTKLRHLQPQSGCFNKCNFCSQSASSHIIEFSWQALEDIIAAIKMVTVQHNIDQGILPAAVNHEPHLLTAYFASGKSLIANERQDRPGIVYSYLDNDPALYPKIDQLAKLLYDNLGVKTRIATVGFSRHNHQISAAFKRLSQEYQHCIAGIRLSISPYTYGWTKAAERAHVATREEFEADLAHFLHLFREPLLTSTLGRKGFCTELRFPPMVHSTEVDTYQIDGHFVLKAGNYLYVAQRNGELVNESLGCFDPTDHGTKVNGPGMPVWQLESFDPACWEDDVRRVLQESDDIFSTHIIHQFENEDGCYYGVDVERTQEGYHFAKYFYPKVGSRPGSGLIDGERYLLNELLLATSTGQDQTWNHVHRLLDRLETTASSLEKYFPESTCYLRQDVMPLLTSYIRALRLANLPANCLFNKRMTVETGQICNLGQAFHEYKTIASRPDLPLTLNHERAFGQNGELANEGIVYRLAPSNVKRRAANQSRQSANIQGFSLEELDLRSTSTANGQSKDHHFFDLECTHSYRLHELNEPTIIGQIAIRNIDA